MWFVLRAVENSKLVKDLWTTGNKSYGLLHRNRKFVPFHPPKWVNQISILLKTKNINNSLFWMIKIMSLSQMGSWEMGDQKFKVTLVYIVFPRLLCATWDPDSKRKLKKQKWVWWKAWQASGSNGTCPLVIRQLLLRCRCPKFSLLLHFRNHCCESPP